VRNEREERHKEATALGHHHSAPDSTGVTVGAEHAEDADDTAAFAISRRFAMSETGKAASQFSAQIVATTGPAAERRALAAALRERESWEIEFEELADQLVEAGKEEEAEDHHVERLLGEGSFARTP